MNVNNLIRLQFVMRNLSTGIKACWAFRICALLTICFWLSACNKDDEGNPYPSASDAKLFAKIDSVWSGSMKNGTAPGMSVVIIKNGKTFLQKSYGYSDIKTKTAVTNNTKFAIGSTTKAMTGLGVLQLVDKGLVKLKDKVTNYIPEFVMKDPRYKDILVEQLLSHSSGIQSFTELPTPTDAPDAIEGIIETLEDEELAFGPGEGFYYSNYGTTLAGLIIQRVAKMPYEEYMQKNLFDQLGMSNTTMEYWRPNALEGTKGYVFDSVKGLIESPPFFTRSHNPAGAGTITTSNDVAVYLTALARGNIAMNGKKLLSDSLTTRWFTGTVDTQGDNGFIEYLGASKGTYGLGWYNITRNGVTTIEHGGNIGSMLSYFFMDPKTKSAVGMLVNQEDFSKMLVAAEVAKMVFSQK